MRNAQQPRWIEVGKNNVRSEQTKEEDEDVNNSEHTLHTARLQKQNTAAQKRRRRLPVWLIDVLRSDELQG
jgi:hypothetical protein